MPDLLFAYGTLQPGLAPAEIADVVRSFEPVGTGTVTGRLFDFGDFPGLVRPRNAKSRVRGRIFRLPKSGGVLERLDEYEGYDPKRPADSLFVRKLITVKLRDGSSKRCWVYFYNRPVSNNATIRSFGLKKRAAKRVNKKK
jgi:gamma-glutamylcyclotransferase (GGCT)/AIG2-like uncharacterized protein YtfP